MHVRKKENEEQVWNWWQVRAVEMASLTQWNELEQALGMVKDRDAGWAAVHQVTKSQI